MAAKAIDIQSVKKRKSKRIRAANKFFSNISLDGKVPTSKDKKEKSPVRRPSLDKEEIKLLSNQSFLDPSSSARPKLLASFSTTDAIEENITTGNVSSISSTSTFNFGNLLEHACFNRATSLRESKYLQNSLINFTSLAKHEGQLSGKRIMLCSGHHVPFAVFSTLKYTQQNKCSDSMDKSAYKIQRFSAEHEHNSYSIKGINIGSKDKPVSYGHLLVPTCGSSQTSRGILSPRKNTAVSSSPTLEESRISSATSAPITRGTPLRMISPREYYHGSNYGEWKEYDPHVLDDPELRSGRHRKVLRLSSFMVSIIEYVKPSQLKKDLNEQFKEKFPNLEITLSKLRSLKQDLSRLASEGKISKANRKLVVGSCLLLAAKFNSDLKKDSVKQLIDHISDSFRVSAKDLLLFEIQSLIAMEFNLHVSSDNVLPHLKRLEFGNMLCV